MSTARVKEDLKIDDIKFDPDCENDLKNTSLKKPSKFIPKPLDLDELNKKLQQLVGIEPDSLPTKTTPVFGQRCAE